MAHDLSNDASIIFIIRSSPNLREIKISHNEIDDDVIDAKLILPTRGVISLLIHQFVMLFILVRSSYILSLAFVTIIDAPIEEIARSCLNIKFLDLEDVSKKAVDRFALLNPEIYMTISSTSRKTASLI